MQHLLSFQPLERLAIDFLKLDRGNIEDVLIMTDSFTKFAVAVPCRDQKASTVAQVLRDHWFLRYGVPMQLHSDGPKLSGQCNSGFVQIALVVAGQV